MTLLSQWTLVCAAMFSFFHVGLLLAPAHMKKAIERFPRHRVAGWCLTILAVVWTAGLLRDMPMGRFEEWKTALLPISVLFAFMVCFFMRELLSVRALGALLLLFPTPILDAARVHPSRWSVVMSVLAYLMVIKGMALVLNPHWFRLAFRRVFGNLSVCRCLGAAGLVLDLWLVWLAVVVYS